MWYPKYYLTMYKTVVATLSLLTVTGINHERTALMSCECVKTTDRS